MKSLHKLHAAAHAKGQNALNVFRKLADDLEASAAQHESVVDEANDRICDLADLRYSAGEAAANAKRQAEAIRNLVG